jgi:N-acetylmuramoyl-L-alanine amidase
MIAKLKFNGRVACPAVLAMLPALSFGAQFGGMAAASAETVRASTRATPALREQVLPRPRPQISAPSEEPEIGVDPIALKVALPPGFRELAMRSGEPQIPGLAMVYLHPLGLPADAKQWRNIIVHRTEGPAGSAKSMALAQSKNPTKRGVTVWVETDGTVYWSTAETVIPTHGDGGNRNDNKYIDNTKTYHSVVKTNSIGVEFVGNYPDVAKPATREQARAWSLLVRFLQERYEIPAENIYAHNWIDFKDKRYCEGCDLASLARKLAYEPGKRVSGE